MKKFTINNFKNDNKALTVIGTIDGIDELVEVSIPTEMITGFVACLNACNGSVSTNTNANNADFLTSVKNDKNIFDACATMYKVISMHNINTQRIININTVTKYMKEYGADQTMIDIAFKYMTKKHVLERSSKFGRKGDISTVGVDIVDNVFKYIADAVGPVERIEKKTSSQLQEKSVDDNTNNNKSIEAKIEVSDFDDDIDDVNDETLESIFDKVNDANDFVNKPLMNINDGSFCRFFVDANGNCFSEKLSLRADNVLYVLKRYSIPVSDINTKIDKVRNLINSGTFIIADGIKVKS